MKLENIQSRLYTFLNKSFLHFKLILIKNNVTKILLIYYLSKNTTLHFLFESRLSQITDCKFYFTNL